MKVSDFLTNSRWLEGPAFLWRHEEDWPTAVWHVSIDLNDQEVRKEASVNTISVCDVCSPTDQLITYFSSWRRHKKAVAWILRLKAMLLAQSLLRKLLETSVANSPEKNSSQAERQRVTYRSGTLTLDELLGAEVAIIRYCQRQRFGEEISSLSSGKVTVS